MSVCNSMLGKYNSSSNCYGTNWLHKGVLQRLITPNAPNGNAVKVIGSTGNVHNNPTNNVYSIRPTLYLNADVVAYSGDGSKCYPYVLYPVKESSQSHSNNAVQYINNLYLNNKNKIVTNNDIEYQYAESVNLMNDRLGGTTTAYDAGNIRYYGVNPNNYVDIGDRDDSCNVIPYRIIGVFKNVELSDGTKKDLIKVIRARSIGDYSFDNKPDGIGSSTSNYGSNDWSDARLMILLNPGYSLYNSNNPLLDSSGDVIYGYRGSLWWNSDSDKCYSGSNNATKSCNFISDGLSKSVHNKIETIFWRLGYSSSAYDHSNDYYAKEITGNKWVGKVALMSLADYGYAADFNGCTDYLHYYTDVCKDNDWLYTGNSQLVLFRYYSNRGWIVTSAGGVYDYQDISTSRSVRPTFYLNSELDIVSGNGTITSPYVIN